jgi:hypothetical protein
MTLFFRRFLGALSLDPGAFEDIEASRSADVQAMVVLLAACAAGGIGAIGLGVTGPAGFVVSALIVLGAWLVWAGLIAALGTTAMADVDTRSDVHELLRVLGYAAAPGVFLAFAAMRSVAPLMVLLVIVWMIAAAVLGVRQALDFRSTARAAAVCVAAFVLSAGAMTAVALLFSRTVS